MEDRMQRTPGSRELMETIYNLVETERRARGLELGAPLGHGNLEPLYALVERHRSLLQQFARFAIAEYLGGRLEGLDALLVVQESDQPLAQLRRRVATAVLSQFAAWDATAE